MIILFGSRGYLGSAIAGELTQRKIPWQPGSRQNLINLRGMPRPLIVLNAAAYIPKPSVALCEIQPRETILGNVILPLQLCEICCEYNYTFAQLSTGCLWNDGLPHAEEDPPQRGFGGLCGMYVGTKLLAEEMIRSMTPKHYIFRVRLPFDHLDSPRNYLRKMAGYETVYDQANSVTHRGDGARAIVDCLDNAAPFGTYHIVNEGALAAKDILYLLMQSGIRTQPAKLINLTEGEATLSIQKLKTCGITMRSAREALEESICNWTDLCSSSTPPAEPASIPG